MTNASRARRFGDRVGLAAALGVLLAVGTCASFAVADEVEHGDDEVVITVTISEFDPCSVSAPGCEGGSGALASTGATLGTALAATVLLTAIGIGTVAATRRRAGRPTRSAT